MDAQLLGCVRVRCHDCNDAERTRARIRPEAPAAPGARCVRRCLRAPQRPRVLSLRESSAEDGSPGVAHGRRDAAPRLRPRIPAVHAAAARAAVACSAATYQRSSSSLATMSGPMSRLVCAILSSSLRLVVRFWRCCERIEQHRVGVDGHERQQFVETVRVERLARYELCNCAWVEQPRFDGFGCRATSGWKRRQAARAPRECLCRARVRWPVRRADPNLRPPGSSARSAAHRRRVPGVSTTSNSRRRWR